MPADDMVPSEDEGIAPGPDASGDDAEQFEDLMANYLDSMGELEIGQVAHARVVGVKKDYVLVDVGDKAEGVVDIREFTDFRGNINIAVGDEVDVVVQSRDSQSGQIKVSHKQARQRVNWDHLVEAFENGYPVHGQVLRALKNGLLVDAGVPCFLPASQIDTGRVENLEAFAGQEIEAFVIDLDRQRHRGILSRRRLLNEERKRKREEALTTLEAGASVSGKVKSIVDFGVFVELQGIDGLVPREEVSWDKHPNTAEILKLGNNYKFKVIAIDKEKGRVTLSRRQLKPDPWLKIEDDYPKELVVKATVTNLTNHCAYVVLEDGIEGRIHRDNLSWVTAVRKPSDILKKGDAVKAVVLGWDTEKRLLELGLKQISTDPWLQIEKEFPVGSRQTVRVSEVMPYGAFVQLSDTAKGLIHVSDMSWDRQFKDPKKLVKIGDEIEAVVLKLDFDARRINLGIKQLQPDPFEAYVKAHPPSSAVTGVVKNVADFGVFVELAPLVEGLLHISQWAREKVESLESAVKPGEEITAKIIKVDREKQKISLSRRAFMADEERREVEQYRQNPATASTKLGSLLRNLKIDVNE